MEDITVAIGTTAAIVGGSVLAGALAGSRKSPDQQTTVTRDVGTASTNENMATAGIGQDYKSMQALVNAGPGQQDVQAGLDSQRSLAQLLQQYSQGGYLPTSQDQQYAQQLLAPQQEAIRQQGIQARQQYNQAAAQSGRGAMDFTFQNKLNQQLGNWNLDLAAQQSQLAAQQPGQRLNYAGQLAQVQSGLASQAMSNRQAIFNMGSQIQQQAQNFRLGSASQTSFTPGTGGGWQGALVGGLGGLGAGMNIANMGQQMGMFGGGSSSPAAAAAPSNAGQSYLGVNSNFGAPMQQPQQSAFGMNYNFGR